MTAVLLCVLDRDHIADVFYHADDRGIPSRIQADGTGLCLGNILTDGTIADLFPQPEQDFPQAFRIGGVRPQQVKHQPKRRPLTDPGQPGEFGDGVFK